MSIGKVSMITGWIGRKRKIIVKPPPEVALEVEVMIEDDKQFWDFRYDILPDETGKLPQWKYSDSKIWELFDWQPWGCPGYF